MPTSALPKLAPDVRLFGPVDEGMLQRFLDEYGPAVERASPVVVEINTMGGDADIARRIAMEIQLGTDRGCSIWLLGKTAVYSAGVTILAAVPVERRFVSRDTVLLIHERRIDKQVHFFGPLRANLAVARDLLAEIENGQRLERIGFEQLIAGSRLPMAELTSRVTDRNWYLAAHEALEYGLIAGIA